MVIFEERRRRPSSGELLIEQGKAMMQPVINGLRKKNQALRNELQALRSENQVLREKIHALRIENQALAEKRITLQKQMEDLQTQSPSKNFSTPLDTLSQTCYNNKSGGNSNEKLLFQRGHNHAETRRLVSSRSKRQPPPIQTLHKKWQSNRSTP